MAYVRKVPSTTGRKPIWYVNPINMAERIVIQGLHFDPETTYFESVQEAEAMANQIEGRASKIDRLNSVT